jgi:5-methylcytosine-specific restriction protein A
MEFRGGNRALRDHIADGKDLHLFKQLGKGEVRYMGCFLCASWEHQITKDRAGSLRRSIIFQLVPIEGGSAAIAPPDMPTSSTREDLPTLRLRALEAASERPGMKPGEAKKHLYGRSEAVRSYVLARANGRCEACGKPAPFARSDGSPYLEPHHTLRESDFGPDHPRWIGGICPSCHREIHFGAAGKELNRRLQDRLGQIEGSD